MEINGLTYGAERWSEEVQRAKARFGIVGNSPLLMEAIDRAVRVAPIDLSVLVVGESGTGKEFFPQIIHAFSARKHAKYIAVNCGAIPEGTIDSELFGHEKGSFTGAVASRKGYFEEADGGTIFLDEVAELPLTTQARLLRVLESGEFLKVGSSEVQRTNIRVVAATNVDMARAVREGRFREDLFYRLSTVLINVPPLRERGDDVGLLARKFVSDFAERYRMPAVQLTPDARRLLESYRWPGNVRQLKNVMEQVALFEAGNSIDAEGLRSYLPAASEQSGPVAHHDTTHTYEHERDMLFNMIFRLRQQIEDLERRLAEQHPTAAIAHDAQSAPTTKAVAIVQKADTRQSILDHEHMPMTEVVDVPVREVTNADASEPIHTTQPLTLEQTERESIRRALLNNNGRRKDTARELNISERTLYRKIRDYGLEEL